MIGALLTDVEGTTSSIEFVKDILFPYAYDALPGFIATRADDPEVKQWLAAARTEDGLDDATPEATIAMLRRWIREDRKSTSLKTLQGMIWETGYRHGDFKAHLYDDAYQKLKAWHEKGLPIYVYSSGSIRAQRLFFGHTVYGDLSDWFAGHFDTATGPKRAAESYNAIAHAIGLPTGQVLFLSDTVAELDAAALAGMRTLQIARPENGAAASERHKAAASFAEIDV